MDHGFEVRVKRRQLVHALFRLVGLLLVALPLGAGDLGDYGGHGGGPQEGSAS